MAKHLTPLQRRKRMVARRFILHRVNRHLTKSKMNMSSINLAVSCARRHNLVSDRILLAAGYNPK